MRKNTGSVLTATLIFILAFTLFGFSSIYLATVQNEDAEKRTASTKAFWQAEAGIQSALWYYRRNLKPVGINAECKDDFIICGEKTWAQTADPFNFAVHMSNDNSLITSTGTSGSTQRTVQLSLTSPFNYALFARKGITLFNSTTIDSYNSDCGHWRDPINLSKSACIDLENHKVDCTDKSFQTTIKDKNQSCHGNVGNNTSSNDDPPPNQGDYIQILNFTTIHGDVSTGPGCQIIGKNSANITGTISCDNNVELPPVIVPSNLKDLDEKKDCPDHSGNINLQGSSLNINAGDYKCSLISLNYSLIDKTGSTLTVKGKVNIYLKGPLSVSSWPDVGAISKIDIAIGASLTIYTDGNVDVYNGSQINNLTQNPKNLILYGTSLSKRINISNDGVFYGAIYAPDTAITVTNNGDIYGSFVGHEINMHNNGQFHYDEALGNPQDDKILIKSWSEL